MWNRGKKLIEKYEQEIQISMMILFIPLVIFISIYQSKLYAINQDKYHIWVLLIVNMLPLVVLMSTLNFRAAAVSGFKIRIFKLITTATIIVVAHTSIYYQIGLDTPNSSLECNKSSNFENALYFSILTFTTLGYGDIKPLAAYRLIASLEALYGYIVLGLLVNIMTTRDEPKNPNTTSKGKPTGRNASK